MLGPRVGLYKLQGQMLLKYPAPTPTGWNPQPELSVYCLNPTTTLSSIPAPGCLFGSKCHLACWADSMEGHSTRLRTPSTMVPRASSNRIHLWRTKVPHITDVVQRWAHRPSFPGHIPRPDAGPSGHRVKLQTRAQQPPNTCIGRATPTRTPEITHEDPGLQRAPALLTSGPGRDRLPGMGLIVRGVIAIQIHPIVIRVNPGGCPVPLWSHLI